jgi:hypothetical protein
MNTFVRLAALVLLWAVSTAHAQKNFDAHLKNANEDVHKECSESGDFIRNIALARQSGKLTRAAALKRLDDDFQIIHAFHPKSRWFAHNKDDEVFLRARVTAAFDRPMDPERQRQQAVQACEEYREGEAGL